MSNLKIHCYFICWNEKFYIPFFHKHYSKFCEKIIMYDQHSTDGSAQLAESLGIEVRTFGNNTLNDQVYLDVKNKCWKECRGEGIDYVIVVDVDEFLVLPKFLNSTLPIVKGYNMISDSLPVYDMLDVNTGSESVEYSKQAIFSPNQVVEINYVHGCHKNNAICLTQLIDDSDSSCFLYHYRMIGGVERLIDRHKLYRERMSEFNKKFNMGFHYNHSDNAKYDEWNYLKSKAKELW
jgi:Glycosyl transferase family 2